MFHLTINGTPFCDWTGCVAHQQRATKAAVRYCTHRSIGSANSAADRLRCIGVNNVDVVAGDCPTTFALHA